ncbi:alpha/beta fold hydrolase [Leptolyngbya sp. FACHB-261]|uniref:alpha/beta fold hydrolase n=1 Tax=Leptolyngbya sp. FACHB-261 TaxID=2692806 RepID=UPI0016854AF7|nr:alpha/beta hydrolase [Leptolyngbya sp. FACHB-261]MBD2102425.1 alpha/beta hydrolase [Leptolyngbya sp. FACHB-261]
MPASFLPPQVKYLSEPTSIALAERIERQPIQTALSTQPIATAYIRQGSGGTPILLLHGFDSSVFEFRRLLPLLAAQNETWALDLLGFGFTERLTGLPFAPPAIKAHLYAFWKSLIQQPMILVGASMGGAAAIDFALTFPQLVHKLVLIASVGYSGSFPLAQFLAPPFDFLAMEWWRQRKLQPLAFYSTFAPWDIASQEALRCAALHLEMPGWYEALLAFTKSGGYSLQQQITQVQSPTLILWGEQDDMLGTSDAAKFKRDIAQSQLIWLKGCGHVPHLEQPQLTAQHILAFR